MTYLFNIQESINAVYCYKQVVKDDDIAQIIEYYFDEIERYETLKLSNPEGGKILIEWHFPEDFENEYNDEYKSNDFNSEEYEHSYSLTITDCFDIIRISDE